MAPRGLPAISSSDPRHLSARLALAAAAGGGELVEISEEKLPDRDWLTENQLAFPPLRIGRFFVYGSHHRGGVPAGAIGIALDAATAFGTGEHPSTRGCLLALQTLAQRRRIAASAGYRHRDRHPVDRRGQAAAAQGSGRRYRCGLGRGRPAQCRAQRRRRPGAGRLLSGIPQPPQYAGGITT